MVLCDVGTLSLYGTSPLGRTARNFQKITIFALIFFRAATIMFNDFLLDRLSKHAKEQPNNKVFSFIGPGIDGGRIQKSYTYNEIAKETSVVAQLLLASGLKAGDRWVAVDVIN